MKPFRAAKPLLCGAIQRLATPLAGLVLLPVWPGAMPAAESTRPAARAAAPQKPPQAPKQAARQAQQQAKKQAAANNPVIRPGDVALQRFVNMTPEERQAAISKLPPQQQAQIMQRLQNYESMTPQARERLQSQLDLLRSLPPKRQNQIRESLRDVNTLPPQRRQVVRQELVRMGNMTDDQRQARMNTEEFRNAYSPDEQTMIGNVAQVLPPKN